MKTFIDEHFLLQTETARSLYKTYASDQPIIDYHCHLDPELIANDHQFENLWEIWLKGDHYKWRAMRANGIHEEGITGSASAEEKFRQWAETVPYTLRNPLYHWTHLELKRYFGITELLDGNNAKKIWNQCNEMLADSAFSTQNLLRKMKVEVVCTTDDPVDDLTAHQIIARSEFEVKVLPTFRPDKACTILNIDSYNAYLNQLAAKAGIDISSYSDLIQALETRHDYFHQKGCRLADHGLSNFLPAAPPDKTVASAFAKIRSGKSIDSMDISNLQNAVLLELARMNKEKGWVQQYHFGALRNNNSKMFRAIGSDTGYDSMGDFPVAQAMSRFFDYLESNNQLSKTIIYNLNPIHNHMVATMIGNFQDGSVPGKMQFGSGWWFLDQKQGMEDQMNVLSNMGLLSRFVGMLTDSRSFLSYPRHEYFRRIMCNLIGNDVEQGLLPDHEEMLGRLIKGISYENARSYFGFIS